MLFKAVAVFIMGTIASWLLPGFSACQRSSSVSVTEQPVGGSASHKPINIHKPINTKVVIQKTRQPLEISRICLIEKKIN